MTWSVLCRLTSYLIILVVVYGCASTNSAIIKAAADGDIDKIKKIHTGGININEKDDAGATALMYAIWSKKPDVAKYLIESGADIKAKDKSSYDALMYAVDYKQFEIINILIEKGADIDSRDNSGMTSLARALWQGMDIEVVKLLIKRGANLNAKDSESQTILDFALAASGRMDIVSVLINAGVKLFEPEDGKSRLLFIGEGFFFKDQVSVSVGKFSKYNIRTGNELAFIDVDPGEHTIDIPVSWHQSKVKADISVKAGQTYYFMISQNQGNRAAGMVGGILLETIVDKTSGVGPFIITPMEESVAQEKIKTLIKKAN